nr:hypothetical protein [uncultured Bacillus sp.]
MSIEVEAQDPCGKSGGIEVVQAPNGKPEQQAPAKKRSAGNRNQQSSLTEP